MRLRGHPVHVMLVHFPVALWPAHLAVHAFGAHLPEGAAGVAGFWLLAAGTGVGWLAAIFGASDLLSWPEKTDPAQWRAAYWHLGLNGAVLGCYSIIAALEWARYPAITTDPIDLAIEALLLLVLGCGNFFGGEIVWGPQRDSRSPKTDAPAGS